MESRPFCILGKCSTTEPPSNNYALFSLICRLEMKIKDPIGEGKLFEEMEGDILGGKGGRVL